MVNGLHLYAAFLVYRHMSHSPARTHVHTVMAEAGVQGADLLVRSGAAFSIQSAPRYYCAHSLTLTHQWLSHREPSGVLYLAQGHTQTCRLEDFSFAGESLDSGFIKHRRRVNIRRVAYADACRLLLQRLVFICSDMLLLTRVAVVKQVDVKKKKNEQSKSIRGCARSDLRARR